jgi:hypothetical protein
MSRMKILNAVEQEQFESPPVCNSVQRKHYFDFSSDLLILSQDLQTPTNQVWGFLRGYAKNPFFLSCSTVAAAHKAENESQK